MHAKRRVLRAYLLVALAIMAFSLSLPFSIELPHADGLSATDAELVAQLQQGSEVAFRTLVTRYQARVYQTALSLLRSPEEAEDVAQEVFVEVYQTVAAFRGEAALSTWLYRLATSRALKHRRWARAKKRFAHFTSLLGLDNQVLHEQPDHAHPQALLEGEQQVRLLRDHISRLPPKQQVAFTLRHEQELSYEEVAAVLATTVPAVESLLFRARQNLQQHLHS
jgi:RNA polymerase sigma factor (sigma-70 family)